MSSSDRAARGAGSGAGAAGGADRLRTQSASPFAVFRGAAHVMASAVERYRNADLARKVVGVGSVGARCWVILLLGRGPSDALFLQAKEAPRSSLERFAGRSGFSNQGQRVVEGQRLMQAATDILARMAGRAARYRGPQAARPVPPSAMDPKTSVDIAAISPSDMSLYAGLLARAHARSGDSIAVASHLGSSEVFDRAIAAFADRARPRRAPRAIATGRAQAAESEPTTAVG